MHEWCFTTRHKHVVIYGKLLLLGFYYASYWYRFEEQEVPGTRSFFTEIIASISDIKFAKDGRYILSRDYMTLKVHIFNLFQFLFPCISWNCVCIISKNEAVKCWMFLCTIWLCKKDVHGYESAVFHLLLKDLILFISLVDGVKNWTSVWGWSMYYVTENKYEYG